MHNQENDTDEIETSEETTYGDILGNLVLSRELTIVIPLESEMAVKTGLKNLKAKQSIKMKKDGLPVPDEILEFSTNPSTEYEDCIELTITLARKGTVIVKKMIIPDNTL